MWYDEFELWRLRNGSAPLRIVSKSGVGKVIARYVKSNMEIVTIRDKLVPYDLQADPEKVKPYLMEEEKMMKNSLYRLTAPNKYGFEASADVYGTKLTTDSAGRYVLELKGQEGLLAVDKADLEEVLPYSVDVTFLESSMGTRYSYFARADDFKAGDLIMLEDTGQFVQIVGIDTKSKKATKWLTGWKLSTNKIEGGEV